MIKEYLVFVLTEHLDDDEIGYSGAIEWVHKNLQNSNVLILSLSDVYLLQYNSKVLDIVNDANNSMLQEGEDDWIISQEAKKDILSKLITYLHVVKDKRIIVIVSELIRLLKLSIDSNKYMYFKF